MLILKKSVSVILIILTFNLFLANSALCGENLYAKADITKNKPVVKTLPEEKIPVETVKGKEGGGNKILWAVLGVALVGGIAAAVGGGGGGGGGGDDPDPVTTGGVGVSW